MTKKILITGGAGFIGTNAAAYFAKQKHQVTIFDNFMRSGSKENGKWLKKEFPNIKIVVGDVRNPKDLEKIVRGQDIIIHLAAQVAVTTSVTDPRTDFEINAVGTFNLLEAVRKYGHKPIVLYSSTNKVYGGMEHIKVVNQGDRYVYKDLPHGIPETISLDFHSPYGCSKGTADQYIHDYGRIYDIPTIVFRQSCIYGPHQFGMEDQGWIAWFIIAITLGKPITIYGDGRQVRDVLYVDDLVRAYDLAIKNIKISKGKIYNVGGGSRNTLSIWKQFGPILEKLFNKKIKTATSDWRPGDQKIYVCDIRLIKKELGWKPTISPLEGIRRIYQWIQENKSIIPH